jgi:RNA polymerase sigma factor (TIGR02999 family)
MNDVTQILSDIQNGQSQRAGDLLPLVYDELRRLASQRMARELPGQTLSPTALVHEAFLRLVGRDDLPRWENRVHFYRAAAQAMRRILIDRARRKMGPKQGGSLKRQPLIDSADDGVLSHDALLEVIALDEALSRLEQADPRSAELIKLRFFAGLSLDDAAAALGISPRTADSWWAYGRAFLAAEMEPPESN